MTTTDINVMDTGMVAGDGITDDTDALVSIAQQIKNQYGGGRMLFPCRAYLYRSLALPSGVTIKGLYEGPADQSANPGWVNGQVKVPLLMPTDSGRPAIYSESYDVGASSGVADVAFWYPGQVNPDTATVPATYPPTIQANSPLRLRRLYFGNSFTALSIGGSAGAGRTWMEDLHIAAYNVGIQVDHCYDTVRGRGIHLWPFHEVGWPKGIDDWVLQHGIGLNILRADDMQLHGFYCFGKWIGMSLNDSPDTSINPRNSCGDANEIGFDQCQYGIRAFSTQGSGWTFTNLRNSAGAPANVNGGKSVSLLRMDGGGTGNPVVEIVSGWEGGPYSGPVMDNPHGYPLRYPDVWGLD